MVNAKINPLGQGFSGNLGSGFINVRELSGKLAYEVAHTTSHFTNQIVLGLLEPKKELLTSIFKHKRF